MMGAVIITGSPVPMPSSARIARPSPGGNARCRSEPHEALGRDAPRFRSSCGGPGHHDHRVGKARNELTVDERAESAPVKAQLCSWAITTGTRAMPDHRAPCVSTEGGWTSIRSRRSVRNNGHQASGSYLKRRLRKRTSTPRRRRSATTSSPVRSPGSGARLTNSTRSNRGSSLTS